MTASSSGCEAGPQGQPVGGEDAAPDFLETFELPDNMRSCSTCETPFEARDDEDRHCPGCDEASPDDMEFD